MMAVLAVVGAVILGPVAVRADADHMVVMADLGGTVIVFVADDLFPVLAQ